MRFGPLISEMYFYMYRYTERHIRGKRDAMLYVIELWSIRQTRKEDELKMVDLLIRSLGSLEEHNFADLD